MRLRFDSKLEQKVIVRILQDGSPKIKNLVVLAVRTNEVDDVVDLCMTQCQLTPFQYRLVFGHQRGRDLQHESRLTHQAEQPK